MYGQRRVSSLALPAQTSSSQHGSAYHETTPAPSSQGTPIIYLSSFPFSISSPLSFSLLLPFPSFPDSRDLSFYTIPAHFSLIIGWN
jgi:hypothetical protein